MATLIPQGFLAASALAFLVGCSGDDATSNGGGANGGASGGAIGAGGGTLGSGGATVAGSTPGVAGLTGKGGVNSAGGATGTGGVSTSVNSSGLGGAIVSAGGTGGAGTGGSGAKTTTTGGTGGAVVGTTSTGGKTQSAGGASSVAGPKTNFTDKVGAATVDMIYVPGGTFTLGCEATSCPADTTPVTGVKVSGYYIGKTEVTVALWNAVMGTTVTGIGGTTGSYTSMTWYDAMTFACKLSQTTGRKYRMVTEAEWEYAAKNHLNRLEKVSTGEEWAYNTWNSAHSGGTDPVGPSSGQYTQKTRRDAQGTVDNITGRLIRSIEGIGPALRLAISDTMDYPPAMVPPCDLHAPVIGDEPVNSYRDPRWVTGSDSHWKTGSLAIGNFDLRAWDDGTARLNGKDGQWFTSNNISFVFVPNTGTPLTFPYIFLDATQGSLISGTSFMSGGYVGRILKEATTSLAKPAVTGLKSGAELAAAAGAGYQMVDMANIPESAKQQDARLLDGTSQGWFQDNTSAGGVHHYRKDIDTDEFRFTVNQGQATMLANGKWFTVNNTFLRITHSTGYTTDYLYAVDADGTFYHNSFQAYERADFRMFKKKANSDTYPTSCGSHCSSEIPKGQGASLYANLANGKSTFVPAACPAGGCK